MCIPQQNIELIFSPGRKQIWVGIGCQKGVSCLLIELGLNKVCQKYRIDPQTIDRIATIETKASEPGLVEFCLKNNFRLQTFSSTTLSSISVPNPSQIITKIMGTPSIAEAAALLCAAQNNSRAQLLVPKEIFRLPNQGSMTIAVATRA
ncbi:cobalamin biosynthesis protein [Cylindrospermopsis raciborskii]|uniref:cobalamin biosynthesis protein n=1 Tax=Cylindrospermopsis raciborskii TaxID=77022 RepID=UPI001BAD683A|nr:cobalamin biosynthesis protein [Cylindrospermopsis raciborskii]